MYRKIFKKKINEFFFFKLVKKNVKEVMLNSLGFYCFKLLLLMEINVNKKDEAKLQLLNYFIKILNNILYLCSIFILQVKLIVVDYNFFTFNVIENFLSRYKVLFVLFLYHNFMLKEQCLDVYSIKSFIGIGHISLLTKKKNNLVNSIIKYFDALRVNMLFFVIHFLKLKFYGIRRKFFNLQFLNKRCKLNKILDLNISHFIIYKISNLLKSEYIFHIYSYLDLVFSFNIYKKLQYKVFALCDLSFYLRIYNIIFKKQGFFTGKKSFFTHKKHLVTGERSFARLVAKFLRGKRLCRFMKEYIIIDKQSLASIKKFKTFWGNRKKFHF